MKIQTKKQRALEMIGMGLVVLAQAEIEEQELIKKRRERAAKRNERDEKRIEKEFRRKKKVQTKRRNRR